MTAVPTSDQQEAFHKMAMQLAYKRASPHIEDQAAHDLAREVADDVTRAWKRDPTRFSAARPPHGYIARSVTHALTDLARHENARDSVQAKYVSSTGGEAGRPGTDPESQVISDETQEVVRRLVATMAEQMREVYTDFLEDVPKPETARRLKIDITTVRTHLQRGAKLMRTQMEFYRRDGQLPPRLQGGSDHE